MKLLALTARQHGLDRLVPSVRLLAAAVAVVGLFAFCARPARGSEPIDPAAAVAAAFARATPAEMPPATPDSGPLPTVSPASAAKTDPAAAACRIDIVNGNTIHSGSGTCVWREEGYSLILTNDHVAANPGVMTVTHDGRRYAAQRLELNPGVDLAVVWVVGDIPAATVAAGPAAVGDKVRHYGRASGGGAGAVTGYTATTDGYMMRTDYRSESGDSGAGVFDSDGRLVGVHCGRFGEADDAERKVTPVPYVNEVCSKGTTGKRFPRLAKLFGRGAVTPADFPASTMPKAAAPGVKAGPACVAGCPCPNAALPAAPGATGGGPVPYLIGPAGTVSGGCPGGVCPAPATVKARGRGRAD